MPCEPKPRFTPRCTDATLRRMTRCSVLRKTKSKSPSSPSPAYLSPIGASTSGNSLLGEIERGNFEASKLLILCQIDNLFDFILNPVKYLFLTNLWILRRIMPIVPLIIRNPAPTKEIIFVGWVRETIKLSLFRRIEGITILNYANPYTFPILSIVCFYTNRKTGKTKSTELQNEKYRINKSQQQNEKYKGGAKNTRHLLFLHLG